MKQTELEAFVKGLPDVQQEENYGYLFYFVGDDHRLPFVTVASSDNEYDSVSNLNRDGVFRINIGISKETFQNLVGDGGEGEGSEADVDYSVLNVFLPHPDYARQYFVCILNPVGENVAETKRLIEEAHAIANRRWQRKTKS